MKLNAFIHTETYSVQSIGPCLLELERETGYAPSTFDLKPYYPV
ncbi:hypothetical protein [Leptothoe sp. PORK10 BA2]|nr:hypothetical protein [Leptothoe sp. PORK10 BA2]MEA5467056.1 hypothetical protein [Leptothoe sp. PORK10 BA2]